MSEAWAKRCALLQAERDEYRDLLHDLVALNAEAWAIGGAPDFHARSTQAWAAARARFVGIPLRETVDEGGEGRADGDVPRQRPAAAVPGGSHLS